MVFTYGGKDHIYVTLDKAAKKSMDNILTYCRENQTDINAIIGKVTQAWKESLEKKEGEPAPLGREEG